MPRMGYKRGPYKRYGHGLCCASRKCVFTTKHRRASPVRATESAASPLCCSGKGGGGRPTPLSNIPPPRLSDIPRTRTPRTLPTAVCAGHPVAVETRAAPAKANPHTSISSHLAATTALNDPPGRTRPGQVSCRTPAFSWAKTRSHAHGRFAQEKAGVRHETRTGYYAAFVRANGGT